MAPRPRRHWALIHHGACATWQARRSQASPHDANGRCTIIRQCGATTQEEEEENRPVHRHHATDGGDSDPAMVFDCVLLHSGASSPHRLVVVAVHTVTFARFRRQARGIGLLTHVRAFMEVLGEQRARKSVRQILVYGVFLVAFTAWYGGYAVFGRRPCIHGATVGAVMCGPSKTRTSSGLGTICSNN